MLHLLNHSDVHTYLAKAILKVTSEQLSHSKKPYAWYNSNYKSGVSNHWTGKWNGRMEWNCECAQLQLINFCKKSYSTLVEVPTIFISSQTQGMYVVQC